MNRRGRWIPGVCCPTRAPAVHRVGTRRMATPRGARTFLLPMPVDERGQPLRLRACIPTASPFCLHEASAVVPSKLVQM